MKTIIGIMEKATLAAQTPTEHEGYVVRELVKEGKKSKSFTVTSPNGSYPKEFSMFENLVCSIMGEQDGLVIRAKMIESHGNPTQTWSV